MTSLEDAQFFHRHMFLKILSKNYGNNYQIIDKVKNILSDVKSFPREIVVQIALDNQDFSMVIKSKPWYITKFGVTKILLENLLEQLLEWYNSLGLPQDDYDWACRALGLRHVPPAPYVSFIPDYPSLTLFIPNHWNPTLQTRAEWLLEAQRGLGIYANTIESQYREAGIVFVPEKKELEKHMRWLAYRVVEKLSPESISEFENVAKQSVQEAIKSTAELLSLPLPKLPSGRRKK